MEITNDGKIAVKGTFDKVIAELGADKVTNINPATVDENTTEVTFSIVGKTGTYNYKISTKEIEKDPTPSQSGGLVYGKVYSGAAGSGTATFYFYPEYNIAIDDSNFGSYADYAYDETNNIVSMNGMDFKVLNDGKSLCIEIEGMEISLELTEEELEYKPTILGLTNLYSGLYYNEETDKFICISETDNSVYYSIGSAGNSFGTNSLEVLLENFSTKGITIIDNKHLELEGATYTLVEELK